LICRDLRYRLGATESVWAIPTIDGIAAKLDVSNIRRKLDEAMLAGSMQLADKLRGNRLRGSEAGTG
jgi:hypothetical protein